MNHYKKGNLDTYSMFVQQEASGKIFKGYKNIFYKGTINKDVHLLAKKTRR